MGSLNKALIIGFLGQDPDIRYMPSGEAAATISVATTNKWKDKQTGEQKERTEWHRCVAFGKRAETIGEYLRKGSQVYIEGEIRTNKYTDKDGIERWSTEIHIFQFSFLDRKEGGSTRPPHPADSSSAQSAGSQEQQTTGAPPAGPGNDDDFDDEIPF